MRVFPDGHREDELSPFIIENKDIPSEPIIIAKKQTKEIWMHKEDREAFHIKKRSYKKKKLRITPTFWGG